MDEHHCGPTADIGCRAGECGPTEPGVRVDDHHVLAVVPAHLHLRPTWRMLALIESALGIDEAVSVAKARHVPIRIQQR
jgi:hypothetical protein